MSLGETYAIELLEDRCLLTGYPIYPAGSIGMSLPWDGPSTPATTGQSAALEVSPFPPAQTFLLHSRPGAKKIIFLDFDGHTIQNTAWNDPNPDEVGDEIPTIISPPYSVDNDGTFNNAELLNIQEIWERVSEDFRPFDVDVTTEDPGAAVLAKDGIRVCIGGSNDVWFGQPAGGVAMIGGFGSGTDVPAFVFEDNVNNGDPKGVAEAVSHEVGHTVGLYHDGQIVLGQQNPTEYYPGHGMGLGSPTGWAPIMGVGYDQELTQWSKGEYPNALTMWPPADPPEPRLDLQDDLDEISKTLPFRKDDHANMFAMATELEFTGTSFFGEGVIEKPIDVDFFAFTIGVEEVVFDIQPFQTGPNLDILAKIHDASGNVLATSNPRDALNADFSINVLGGTLQLTPGTYYISIDGTGKPFTTDPGYTDYGSLGYYSINGTRKSLLEVLTGIDFDISTGSSPTNWTRYSGGPAVFSDLRNENGATTPYNLSISSTGGTVTSQANAIGKDFLPFHTQPLNGVGGFLVNANAQWTFTFSDLEPLTVYEIYVFGTNDGPGGNHVELLGNGPAINFTQTLAANQLAINGQTGSRTRPLSDYARTIQSTTAGDIRIKVTNETGAPEAAIAGLAIREGTFGSISGVKWNDEDGDGVKDASENGLPGWTIYFDDNDNGQLDSTFATTTPSVDVPQAVADYTTVKSELLFQGVREVLDINVRLDISHTFDADLNVYLISPSGTRVELFTDVGGVLNNFTNTVLDDEAPTSITTGTAPFTGSFRPEQPLSTFDGENASGTWTLEITDDAENDEGVLNSWSLTITGSERSTTTGSDGSYLFDDLPPGVYNVREVLRNDWMQTLGQPPVTVSSGGRVTGVNFGNRQGASQPEPGSIAGQVWDDQNGDGVKDGGEPGLPNWRIYIDGNDNGQFDTEAVKTVASTAVPRPIDDFATITSEVLFSGLNSVDEVTVTLDITHSFDGDLDVYLLSPAGTQVELFGGVGGQFNNFQNTTLDQNAAVAIVDGTAPFTGTFRPEGLLSDFQNENPNGIWRLLIRDTAEGDEGTLNSWSLTVAGQELSVITDASGNYSFDDVVPGSYVVRQVLQPGWSSTHAPANPVVLSLNQQLTNVNFGNRQSAGGLLGDYNSDAVVDLADYVIWRMTMNQSVPPFSGADGSGNGVVDQADYGVWRAHYGASVPAAGSGSVAAASFIDPSGGSSQSRSVALVAAADDSQSDRVVGRSTAREKTRDIPPRRPLLPETMPRRHESTAARGWLRDAGAVVSGDAALLAWLSTQHHNVDPELDNRWDRSTSAGADDEVSMAVDSIDTVFESFGRLAVG